MILSRLIYYLKPFQKRFWITMLALLFASGAEVSVPLLVSRYLDHFLIPGHFEPYILGIYGTGIILLYMFSAGLYYWQLLSFQTIAQWIVKQLRMDVFAHVQQLGLRFFDRVSDGVLVSQITNDTEAVKELFVFVLSAFLQNTVLILAVFIGMFTLDVQLASWLLLLLPVIFCLMHGYRYLSSKIYKRLRHLLGLMNAKLNESITGMNIIQAFRQEERFRQEFGLLNEKFYKASLKHIKLFSLMLRPATQLLSLLVTVSVVQYFGYASFVSSIQLGVLYGFLNLLDRIYEPINEMMMRLSQLQQSVVAAERVFKLTDQAEFAPVKSGNESPVIEKGHIQFEGVYFSYDGKQDVLKNITFEVKPGQTAALVGHTGSGKSSVIHLLMHFYAPDRGMIKIDGKPLAAYDNEELRSKLGLVLQDPFLFVGDVTSNICLHNEKITLEQAKEAARFVQAAPFIEQLPRAWEEPVAERGATLSNGQRQLISFARTMAIQPKILLLDEATASVDTETEEAIHKALQKMRQGRTTLAIAHRLSTIRDADLILVLHQGEIFEQGTHRELMEQKGLYHKMYRLQRGDNSLSFTQ